MPWCGPDGGHRRQSIGEDDGRRRAFGTRCRQEDRGAKAVHHGGFGGQPDRGSGSPGRRAGPGRCAGSDGGPPGQGSGGFEGACRRPVRGRQACATDRRNSSFPTSWRSWASRRRPRVSRSSPAAGSWGPMPTARRGLRAEPGVLPGPGRDPACRLRFLIRRIARGTRAWSTTT